MKATLKSDGEILVPLPIRQKLGLQPGAVLDFDENAPFLKATKIIDEQRMRSVLGCCRDRLTGHTGEQWLNETRGPVELPPHAHRD